jgi:uncharacterized membrane protein
MTVGVSSPERGSRRSPTAAVILVVVAAAILCLAAGFFLKACPAAISGRRPGLLCYSDIPQLYDGRGIRQHIFPYVHKGASRAIPGQGEIEYPVLTGLFMWATGFLASTPKGYLFISAALLAPFAIGTGYLLARMTRWRALLWTAAPGLVLYAFHNWDLLAVCASVAGLYQWWRRRSFAAAALFAIGGALKLYPLLFLGPLALEPWRKGERGRALGTIGLGAGVWTVINLPFILASPRGWAWTYQFQGSRPPNIDSVWGLSFSHLDPGVLTVLVSGLLVASLIAVLIAAHARAIREGSFPFLQACGALLAAFLLLNKVQSPQYILWILPFFALLNVNLRWWFAYSINDLVLYVVIFMVGRISLDTARPWLYATIYARAALLAIMIVIFLWSRAPAPADRARAPTDG